MQLTALLFAVAAALAGAPENATIVHVGPDGWATRTAPGESGGLEGTFWVWSPAIPPYRIDASTAEAPHRSPKPSTRTIEVRGAKREQLSGLDIRWGTKQMLADLPDSLLPVARTDAKGRCEIVVDDGDEIYARAAGHSLASRWLRVAGSRTAIYVFPAAQIAMRVLDSAGAAARHARLVARTIDAPQPDGVVFRGQGDGTIDLLPIPAATYLDLTLWAEGAAAFSTTARSSSAPSSIRLPPGFAVSGIVVDSERKPLAGAVITARSATGREPVVIDRRAISDARGRFSIGGISGNAVLTAKKAGLASATTTIRAASDTELPPLVLTPQRNVTVSVVDEKQRPIADVLLKAAGGVEAKSDAQGIAELRNISTESVSVTASKSDFLDSSISVPAGPAAKTSVTLRRAAVVRATVVAHDRRPAGPGTILVDANGRTSVRPFPESGRIEIGQLDECDLTLEIRAAGRRTYRIPRRHVTRGEIVDLGVIELDNGPTLHGVVADAATGAPIGGATVRMLRPNTFGPVLAAAQKDWIETTTANDGSFDLHGVEPAMRTLWIQAADHAPHIDTAVEVDETGAVIDAGTINLSPGHLIHMQCEPVPRCGSRASAIIASADWLPVESAMNEGEAMIGPVPAGPLTLRLSNGARIVHEREVRVAADETSTEIRISLRGVTVKGRVTRRGKPVDGGTVVLTAGSDNNSPFIQLDMKTDAGTVGKETLGSLPSRYQTTVDSSGSFTFDDVPPGEYKGQWIGSGGAGPRGDVHVAATGDNYLDLDLRASSIDGLVKSSDGRTFDRCVVTVEKNGTEAAQTVAGSDGVFHLGNLAPGRAKVRAFARGGRAAEKEIEIPADGTINVELLLEQAPQQVAVKATANGAPVANAFVFALVNGSLIAATTASDGRALLKAPESPATALAVFAPSFGWSFPVADLTPALDAVVELAPSTGGLEIKSPAAAQLSIAAGRFPFDAALRLLGMAPVTLPGRSLRIDRLAPGSYAIGGTGINRTVVVGRDPVRIDLP